MRRGRGGTCRRLTYMPAEEVPAGAGASAAFCGPRDGDDESTD